MFWLEFTIILARVLIEIIFFAIGASIYSFLNVVIYRLPRHIGFTGGSSICTSCHHELTYKDMIPVLSWVFLKGRCRYCGVRVSIRYTLFEFLGGTLAVVFTMLVGINFKALRIFIIVSVLIAALSIIIDKVRYGSDLESRERY